MAYSFTAASSQYLSITDHASLDITGAMTMAAWIKSSGSYATRGIISKFETSTNQRSYGVYINSSGQIVSTYAPSGTSVNVRADTATTSVGTNWRHISCAFVPSASISIFYDGSIQTATNNGSAIPSSIFSGTAPLWIGTVSSTTNNWDGLIAEVGIWNAALTAAEVASLAKGMTCDKIRPQSLAFYAPLVRNLVDQKGGRAITNNNGATVAPHPRVYA